VELARREERRTAIRDRLQLLVRSLVREPSFNVVLDGGGVVEGSRDDRDDLVRKLQRLVESFRVGGHLFEHLHRLLGLGDTELQCQRRGVSRVRKRARNGKRRRQNEPARSSRTDEP